VAYETLADVYEWLVPEPLLTPEGSVAAFDPWLPPPPARVLDCACGTGVLAAGLAALGFDVIATDASEAMVRRARERGVAAERRAWEELAFEAEFDAVLCVGNSLTHAPGVAGRRGALSRMAAALRPGGVLLLTSRNWERLRERVPGLEIDDRLVERNGRRAVIARAWTLADSDDEVSFLDTAVVFVDGDAMTPVAERLEFWPFTYAALLADLDAAGLEVSATTIDGEVDRYMVAATR
jgi:SAM-dependent methyltransferase